MHYRKLYVTLLVSILVFFVQAQNAEKFNEYYRKSIYKVQDLAKNKQSYFECDTSVRRDYNFLVFELLGKYGKRADSVAALFYFIKNDSLSIWLAKKNKLYEETIKVSKDTLLKLETDLRAALKVESLALSRLQNRGGEVITETSLLSEELAIRKATSVLLPKKIAEELKGLLHLIVIPEFNIGRFPFYVLKPFDNNEFLVDRLSVSFAPHLCNMSGFMSKYYGLFGERNSVVKENALVVGDPVYQTGLKYSFKQLPGAEEEAKQVAGIFGTKAITGIDAKKSVVVSRAQSADLLYFATHGVFDMEAVLQGSFLAFTPDSKSSTGLWTASEIQEDHFNARLAVLSACQTGIGKIYEGGFFGIGRTFFIGGVANTVTSLWSVDDLATKNLMTIFARELTEPDYFYPSQHLRKAILKYKGQGEKKAADWSAFMVFGYSF
jgi:CHAT domain